MATFKAAQWHCFRKDAEWKAVHKDFAAIAYIPVIALFMQGNVLGNGKYEHMLLAQKVLGVGVPFTLDNVRFPSVV